MYEQPVRTTVKAGIVITVLLATVFVVGLALGGLFILFKAPLETGLTWLGLGLFVFSLYLGYTLSRTNLWVESEGDTVRERRLLTGSIVERWLAEVTEIVPLVSGVGGITEAVMDAILRTPNRGFLIRFQEGRRIVLIRGETKGLDEFMTALRERLGPSWTNRPA
jgi:hypothetical protein